MRRYSAVSSSVITSCRRLPMAVFSVQGKEFARETRTAIISCSSVMSMILLGGRMLRSLAGRFDRAGRTCARNGKPRPESGMRGPGGELRSYGGAGPRVTRGRISRPPRLVRRAAIRSAGRGRRNVRPLLVLESPDHCGVLHAETGRCHVALGGHLLPVHVGRTGGWVGPSWLGQLVVRANGGRAAQGYS